MSAVVPSDDAGGGGIAFQLAIRASALLGVSQVRRAGRPGGHGRAAQSSS